jgi:hypothetical protein
MSFSFEHWELQANKEFANLEALGFRVVKVLIDPSEFTDWCKASKRRHDFFKLDRLRNGSRPRFEGPS